MLSPLEEGNAVAKLVHVRHRFPIRVTIVEDLRYSDPALKELVRRACQKWAEATKGVSKQRFTFTVDRRTIPRGADVIVFFGAARDFKGYIGHTAEHRGWAEIRLALTDLNGDAIGLDRVSRIATHEMGHALGIWGHSPDAADVMSLSPYATEVTKADVNTLRLAYHPSNPNR